MLPFIQTEKGLSLIIGGKMRTISADDPVYQEVLDAIKAGADDAAVFSILNRNLNRVTEAVQNLVEKQITDSVTISGGLVLFRGEPVHNSLTDRMLKMLDEGFDLAPMARFLENLMENPSYRAVNDLYSFLEYGKMPITEDGHFLAYKAVRPDYMDIHSGTMDNSIGKVVEMPRNRVDEDPNRTCSYGLHVCSFEYLPHFAHANGHVVICKVNPRDVVAIPRDYNNTKMRVCRYEVIGEHEGYYTEHSDVLSGTTVATEEEPFLVIVEGTDPHTRRYARLSDAAAYAEDALTESSTERVTVKNGITDVVLLDETNPDFVEDDAYDDDDDFDDADDAGDSSDDADGDREPLYEIVIAENRQLLEEGNFDRWDWNIESLSDAQAMALRAKNRPNAGIVQVREQSTGEVKLTLT